MFRFARSFVTIRYYAEKQRQQEQASQASAAGGGSGDGVGTAGSRSGKTPARQGGVYNHGMDDENFDYIVHDREVFKGRYSVRETIGKGEDTLLFGNSERPKAFLLGGSGMVVLCRCFMLLCLAALCETIF